MEKRSTDKLLFFFVNSCKYYQEAKQGVIENLKQNQQDEK